MLADKYEEIFSDFKNYIENNSQYSARVVKYNTNTSTYFPIIDCYLSNNIDTDDRTIDGIEYYESFYFTINIYAKDKTITYNDNEEETNIKVSAQVIIDELNKLVQNYFGGILGMKKTLNKPTPNLDTSILRQTLNYQCLIGNARANIIRR